MPLPLRVTRGADYVSVVNVSCTTASQSFAFVPKDYSVTGSSATSQVAIFAEEMIVTNMDPSNTVFIRLAMMISTPYNTGGFGGTANVPSFAGAFTVNPTLFQAAVLNTDILIAPGARNVPLYAKCVGFSIIASLGTPLVAITAFGSMMPPNS